MNTIVLDDTTVHIPAWVVDHASFRRWVSSDDFPENRRACYLAGEVWVDMSPEQVYSHNHAKTEVTVVLGGLIKASGLGWFHGDGVLITNEQAELSTEPDGASVSTDALREGRVEVVDGALEGYIELAGAPDMVLEVVSRSSVRKDTKILPDLYHRAGIPEYWLIDARGEELRFDIYRHTTSRYVATRRRDGWLKSNVFGKSFKLTCAIHELGYPVFTLDTRP